MNYVIVGSGPAGTYAAAKLRQQNKEIKITILSEETYPLYARPRLPDFVCGKVEKDALILFKDDWYKKNDIDLKLKTQVTEIDKENKKVITNNGNFVYDKLLIASGSKPVCLPFGVSGANICTLRTIEDGEKIIAELAGRRGRRPLRICVIGGGVLGLEIANGFVDMGLNVCVIERDNYILKKQLDEEGSLILKEKLENLGLDIITGVSVSKIEDDKVFLDNDSKIDADFILLSVGVCASIGFAQNAGINCDKGIVINNKLETNIKDVYAAGDCASYKGCGYGFWITAKNQGEAAAESMLCDEGKECKIADITKVAVTTKVCGISAGCIGDLCSIKDLYASSIKCVKNQTKDKYLKLFIKNDVIILAVYVGEIKDKIGLKKVIESGGNYEPWIT